MRHNRNNPQCPECNSITQKHGFVATRKGRKQRFRCTRCGLSFK